MVRRILVEDAPESAWSGLPRLPTAQLLARIARDPDEELELRVRAVVTLGEVFHYLREVLGSLRPLACTEDTPPPLAEATMSAIDPGRAPDESWCRDAAAPGARSTFGFVAAGWLYGSIGFGLDRKNETTGAIEGGGFALGAGTGVELGLRIEDVSVRLAAHATTAFLGSSQSRWFAAMGPLLLVDVILEPGLHFAAGGGFDWGQSAVFDGPDSSQVDGFFPALHLRTIVVDGELAVGGMLHFFLPVEHPELFGLTIGLTVGAHTRE